MKRCTIKHVTLCTTLALGVSVFIGTLFFQERHALGQHAGGGIIDTSKQPGKDSPSFHQSFAPYEGTVPLPWIDEKPIPITIKVVETITYEIPVDEKKFQEKKLTFEDLELKEVANNSEINFHQVDCYFFNEVKQTQVRTIENLSCKRERDGTQYWLSDGKKYVEWGKWSIWGLEKEEKNKEMAVKKP